MGKNQGFILPNPKETVFQGDQVVDYWKFPDIEVFKLAIAKGNTK